MKPIVRMHTAEHILSAIMRRDFGAPRNLELHLGDKKTKCDYQPAQPLGDADIIAIEASVNAEIQRDYPVSEAIITRRQAGDYDLWKVPPEAETIRIVRIGDLDAQPCSGEHVNRTREIGHFHIISHEQRDNGRLRIRFRVK